jgi:hemolysin III
LVEIREYSQGMARSTASARAPRRWSIAEEAAHAVSHGAGTLLAIVGLTILVAVAARRGTAREVTTVAIFGSTLVLLYLASTLYHAIPARRAKPLLRRLDHAAIYLAIAGTYTPFALGPLRGPLGWSLLAVVWSGAIAGIAFEWVAIGRAPILSTALYVGLGWCVVVALGPLAQAVGAGGVALLLAGGLCYTLGIGFYGWKRLPFHHFVWHLCVLAGSVLHWFAVLRYVIPRPVA